MASVSACDPACDGCSAPGANKCKVCASGFHLIGEICEDIDECAEYDMPKCPEGKLCINKTPGFLCQCPQGMEESSEGKCIPKKGKA